MKAEYRIGLPNTGLNFAMRYNNVPGIFSSP